jgi:hypothetical protein
MNAKNNVTQGTRGFIQIRASVRTKTLCPVRQCIMIHWVETPSTPPFINQGGRVYKEDLGRLILFLTRTVALFDLEQLVECYLALVEC